MANPPKVPITPTSTHPSSAAALQEQITLALLSNGGIARIQTALRQRLDEAGWSEALRDTVTRLLREGECATYFEAVERVKKNDVHYRFTLLGFDDAFGDRQ